MLCSALTQAVSMAGATEWSISWPDGAEYRGDFVGGYSRCNRGTYAWKDGSNFHGDVAYGIRNGSGKYTDRDGLQCEGNWVDGARHGHGCQYFDRMGVSLYKGDWCNDKRHGFGKMVFVSGCTYEGFWSVNQQHGVGILQWQSGERCVGTFMHNQSHGFAQLVYPNLCSSESSQQLYSLHSVTLNVYRGQTMNGHRHGLGTHFYSNGSQCTGSWIFDKKQGPFLQVKASGEIAVAWFAQDRLVIGLQAQGLEDDQVKLHIEDITTSVNDSDTPASNFESSSKLEGTFEKTRELERLFTRNLVSLRRLYSRLCAEANQRRSTQPSAKYWEHSFDNNIAGI
ncbi:unnamed protein product [Sphagnum compactum]